MQYKRHLSIINPLSGRQKGPSFHRDMQDKLSATFDHVSVYLTRFQYDIDGIRNAISSFKPDVISVFGGDGTVNDVVNALQDYSIPIHLMPIGTGNDVFGFFHPESKAKDAPDFLFNPGPPKEIDIGLCNGRAFVNGIGIGFDGSITKRTVSNNGRWLPLGMKYAKAIAGSLLFYDKLSCDVIIDGEKLDKKTAFMISVANGRRYGGSFHVAPLAEMSDGLLDLVHIGPVPRLKRAFYIPKVQHGRHLDLPFVTHRLCHEIILTSSSQMPYHIDGEFAESDRIEIQIAPDKLQLLL